MRTNRFDRVYHQVFRRSQDPKNFQTSLKDIPFAPLPILPPEMLTGGNKKDCIRVRNLPVECGIEQILEFLGVHSQHIVRKRFIFFMQKLDISTFLIQVAQGVHMVYNAHVSLFTWIGWTLLSCIYIGSTIRRSVYSDGFGSSFIQCCYT